MPPVERHDAAGRVLDRRRRADVFRRRALLFQIGKNARQRIDPDAVVVERRGNHFDAKPAQIVQVALIGELFEDHRIARLEQHRVDEVDRLARALGDQDIVGPGVDATPALDLVGDKLAQARIALRSQSHPVERELGPLAAQYRRGRLDEPLNRDQRAVVVAADEIVFGVAGPARRRRRQCLAE